MRNSGVSSRYVEALTQLGVPCFYPTRDAAAIETQRRLVRVLHTACRGAGGRP